MTLPTVTVADLAARYDALFFDAYGVLNDDRRALPGAAETLAWLTACEVPWYVVTNDASRLPSTSAERYRRFGLDIAPERMVTSGGLLAGVYRDRGLAGARTIVLGTDDSREYVRAGGGRVVAYDGSEGLDAVVVADDDGYPFLGAIEDTLSAIASAVTAGSPPVLLLPNPDLIYPKASGAFGFTAGAVAMLLEAGLERRFGDRPELHFERLGKPHTPLFEEAMRRAGTRRVVMIGDQLETDIAGARAAGIDAALVAGGISRVASDDDLAARVRPTYLLPGLAPGRHVIKFSRGGGD